MAKRYAACMVYFEPSKPTAYNTFDSIRECLEFLDSSYDHDAYSVSVISDWSDEQGIVNKMQAVCTRVGIGDWCGENDLTQNINAVTIEGAR